MARRSRTSPKRWPGLRVLVVVEVLLHDRELGVGVDGGPVEADHTAGVLDPVHIATGDTYRDGAPGVRGERAAEAVARLRATGADHRLVIDLLDAPEAALRAAQPVDLLRAGLAQDGLPRRPHEKVGAVVRVVEACDVVPGSDRRAEPGTRLRLQPIEVIRGQKRPRGRRPRMRGTLRGDVGEHHDRACVRLARRVVRRQADHDVRAAAIKVRWDVVPAPSRSRGRHTGQPEHGDRSGDHGGGKATVHRQRYSGSFLPGKRVSRGTAGVWPVRILLSSRRSTSSAGRARPSAATNAESQVMNFGSASQW